MSQFPAAPPPQPALQFGTSPNYHPHHFPAPAAKPEPHVNVCTHRLHQVRSCQYGRRVSTAYIPTLFTTGTEHVLSHSLSNAINHVALMLPSQTSGNHLANLPACRPTSSTFSPHDRTRSSCTRRTPCSWLLIVPEFRPFQFSPPVLPRSPSSKSMPCHQTYSLPFKPPVSYGTPSLFLVRFSPIAIARRQARPHAVRKVARVGATVGGLFRSDLRLLEVDLRVWCPGRNGAIVWGQRLP